VVERDQTASQGSVILQSNQSKQKERPSQQAIAIIAPDHLCIQKQPLGKEIRCIQKQLTVFEQERAILYNKMSNVYITNYKRHIQYRCPLHHTAEPMAQEATIQG